MLIIFAVENFMLKIIRLGEEGGGGLIIPTTSVIPGIWFYKTNHVSAWNYFKYKGVKVKVTRY